VSKKQTKGQTRPKELQSQWETSQCRGLNEARDNYIGMKETYHTEKKPEPSMLEKKIVRKGKAHTGECKTEPKLKREAYVKNFYLGGKGKDGAA